MTKANVARFRLETNFRATFPGSTQAQPLYVDNGPGGKGAFFVVTLQNNVYALDETTGAVVWMRNVGDPAMLNGPNAPCGNIRPLGILSTPVIDAASRTLFVGATIGNASQILRHEIHALSIDDGSTRPGWPVNVSTAVGFDPQPHNPRSALSLVNGIVYAAYGGHLGDCGGYRGRIVGVDIKDPTKVGGWVSSGGGSGIWAHGGMASDGQGVIATTGNGASGQNGAHLDSEQVLRVRGLGTFDGSPTDRFVPSNWKALDDADADFAASSPLVFDAPGSTPLTMVAAVTKQGQLFLLDSKRLGGLGGQLSELWLAMNHNSAAYTAPTAYQTNSGTFLSLSILGGICPDMPNSQQSRRMMGVKIMPGSPARMQVAWCAAGSPTSPMSTTTDGKNEPLVWYANGNQLWARDGETGAQVYNSGGDVCDYPADWTTPIAVKGRIVLGARGRLCAWSAP